MHLRMIGQIFQSGKNALSKAIKRHFQAFMNSVISDGQSGKSNRPFHAANYNWVQKYWADLAHGTRNKKFLKVKYINKGR